MVIFKSMINDDNIILSDNEINIAIKLASKTFSYNEVIEKLKSNDDKYKAIYILNLNDLKTKEDANLLWQHLTCYPNDIREACAFKLDEFLCENNKNKAAFSILTENKNATNIILKSITDINPSICRFVIGTLDKFKFQELLQTNIIKKSFEILENENLSETKKGYKINKQMFALYWNLEALSHLDLKLNNDLKELLIKCANMNEFYTIREKISKIIYINSKFNNDNDILNLKKKLKLDSCFYVSRFFNI